MARLRAARPRPVILRSFFWAPLAAAAAAVIAALALSGNEPAKVTPQPELATEAPKRVPVASKQHLMEVVDLGVVEDAAEQPVRLIRTTWLDEIYYASAPGQAPEKESQVREEVMPVALTIY